MKYIDAEKLIERLEDMKQAEYENCGGVNSKTGALQEVQELIESLQEEQTPTEREIAEAHRDAEMIRERDKARIQQEQPNKYETALEKAREWMPNVNQGGHATLIDIFPELGEGLDPRYGGRKQEQPEVDLEKEMDSYFNEHFSPCVDGTLISERTGMEIDGNDYDDIARHFYELGLNARKEENI